MKSGIKKVAFYNPSDGTTVLLNHISTESNVRVKEPLANEKLDGGLVFAGEDSELEIIAFDDFPTQLETWMQDETELRAVVYGVDSHILWEEDAPITVTKNISGQAGGRNAFRVVMTRKGGVHNIYSGNNILYVKAGWGDENSDGIADNYDIDGDVMPTFSFSSQTQRIAGSCENFSQYKEIVYPVAGAKLKMFSNIEYSSAPTAGNISVEQFAFDGSLIASNTGNLKEVLEVELVAGVYTVQVNIVHGLDLASGETLDITNPYFGTREEGEIRY